MGSADDGVEPVAEVPPQRAFRDRHGRRWVMGLSFALWRSIRDELGVDLLDVAMPDGKALSQLTRMDSIGPVLWAYVADQAAAAGIDRDDFWRSLHGQAIEHAMTALVEDLEDFSRSPQFAALRVAMDEAAIKVDGMRAAIHDPTTTLGQQIRQSLSTPGAGPASSPGSSAATHSSGGPSATCNGPPTVDAAPSGTAPA